MKLIKESFIKYWGKYGDKINSMSPQNYSLLCGLTMAGIMMSGVVSVGVMEYNRRAKKTGTWNPIKQSQVFDKQYRDLHNKLFIDPAYADRDRSGTIDEQEKIDVFGRMGLFHDSYKGFWFGEPKLKDLETAVRSYEIGREDKEK